MSLATFSAERVVATLAAPVASASIYRQQQQMHRFVHEFWRGPVAANDIGALSYRNEDYVLDLWGLGSEDVRRLRASGAQDWMGDLVSRRNVDVALIYEEWFPDRPAPWRRVARLVLQGPVKAVAYESVAFYATRSEATDRVCAALRAFAPTLPAGVRLEWDAACASDTPD